MRKIIALLAAVVLCVSMAVSASALEGSADISLNIGNSADWTNVSSDPVTVDADGEYTLRLTDISVAPDTLTVLYIKDAAVAAEEKTKSDLPSDIQILTKSLKINGNEIALTEGYPTTLTDDGVFDICWYNIWAASYFTVEGMDAITDVEVTFEVVSGGEAATSEPVKTDDADAATAPEATDNASDAVVAPAADSSEPAKTGIVLTLAPMALAVCAVVISKKK